MKSTNFQLIRYDADDGHVFDWAEPHYVEVEKDGKIENYIEVAEPVATVEEA